MATAITVVFQTVITVDFDFEGEPTYEQVGERGWDLCEELTESLGGLFQDAGDDLVAWGAQTDVIDSYPTPTNPSQFE